MFLGFFRRTQITYKRPQTYCHNHRSYISILHHPTLTIPPLKKKNQFNLNITRQYSYGGAKDQHHDPHHKDSHHHHESEEIKELPDSSPEYLEKYYGHLFDPENKPDDFWPMSVFNSPLTLECLAEINSTEFKFPKLEAKALKEKYKEQLGHFETIGKENLLKEGISARIVHYLHQLYKLRAAVPLWELKNAISELGFLKKHPNYRVTTSVLSDYPQWKQAKPQFFLNSLFLNTNFDPAKSLVGHTSTNEEEAAANVRHFKGARGLLLALEKGLSPSQREHIHNVLGSSVVTGTELQTVAKLALDFKEEHHYSEGERTRINVQAVSNCPPGTPGFKKLQEMLPEKEESTELVVHPTLNPIEFKDRLVKELTKDTKTENQAKIEKLTQAIEYITQPQVQDDLQILHLLTNRDLTPQQQVQLLSIFVGDDGKISDAVLMDALNPHPLSAKIIGKRAQILMEEDVHYTRKFKEGAESTIQEVSDDPRYQKYMENPPDAIVSPTPSGYPFNNALEEIYHLKLEYLAQTLGFDLHNELGLAKFDLFCQTYDISPGEFTLDRCHQYPPPHHTYEELPILKFDGYNPYLEDTPPPKATDVPT